MIESTTTSRPRLIAISGAGLSAESGLATFRDPNGIWSQYDLNIVCSYRNWISNRKEIFDFHAECKHAILGAHPNLAHRQLAAWQNRWGADRVHLVTQNVDDLLERAGAKQVLHLHGDLFSLTCEFCYRSFPIGNAPLDRATPCPHCGQSAYVKPGSVLFGEPCPRYHDLAALLNSVTPADILLVIGTSMQVLSAYHIIPLWRAGHERTWQVNPVPVETHNFSQNLALSATVGIAELAPRVMQIMTA